MSDRDGGAPAPGRSRLQQGPRDLLLSMLPLVLVALAVAGLASMCSFSPGGPTIDPRTFPSVDAAARLEGAAETVGFPVRVPRLPAGWEASAAEVDRMGPRDDASSAVRIGWRTPGGNYLRLSQSTAGEPELAAYETGQQAAPTGAVQGGDRTLLRYPGRRAEEAWVTDVGDVRLLITGSGTGPEFRTLARAALDARVLGR